jgi:hypothetical protein
VRNAPVEPMTVGAFYLWIVATDLALGMGIWKAVEWLL